MKKEEKRRRAGGNQYINFCGFLLLSQVIQDLQGEKTTVV